MMTDISLSASAAKHINHLSQQAGHEILLRIAVEGGGCSGFQYKLSLIDSTQDDDALISYQGARAAIDSVSLPLMSGSIIDYTSDLVGEQFKILNPNAASSCGCGISFSL